MSAKCEFIDAQKAFYPIRLMCLWAGVSTSGYYDWRARPVSATAARRARLGRLITAVFEHSDETYGHRRIQQVLGRSGVPGGPELVRSIMRELGLDPCQPRPFRPTTTIAGDAHAVADLVGRDFTADTPGTKLVGDITYIPTWEGFVYLPVMRNSA